jgi:hypothetical protein
MVVTDVSTLSATLKNLTAFTDYECTISASTGPGEGNSSDSQSASTDEDGRLYMGGIIANYASMGFLSKILVQHKA